MDHQARQRVHLRVKLESLAAEARMIRRRERAALRKAKVLRDKEKRLGEELGASHLPLKEAAEKLGIWENGQLSLYEGLQRHRRGSLRYEARLANLTMAFLKGTPYGLVETKNKPNKRLNSVHQNDLARMVQRFGGTAMQYEVNKWVKARDNQAELDAFDAKREATLVA